MGTAMKLALFTNQYFDLDICVYYPLECNLIFSVTVTMLLLFLLTVNLMSPKTVYLNVEKG